MDVKKLVAFLIMIMMLGTLVVASCGEAGPEEVVIGLTAPLSGGGAEYGKDVQTGMEMAIDEINEAGGVQVDGSSYDMKLVSLDDAADPEQGVANATRLVTQDGAKVIWCPVATVIFPMLAINEKTDEEFLIMAYSSVSQVCDEGNTLIACFPPPFTTYTVLFTELAMQQGWTNLAMVQTTGAYGDAWAMGMGAAWQGGGGTVVEHARADYYTETDFVPFLTKALEANPDVLLIGGPTQPTALVVEQAKSLGFTGGFIIMDQAKIDGMAEQIGLENLENCIGVAPVEDPFPGTTKFAEAYEKTFDRTVTWESAINYTGVYILKDAMEKAQSIDDPAAIRKALPDVFPISGDEFPVAFEKGMEARGLMHMPSAITMVKDGQYTLSEDLIYWWEGDEEQQEEQE